MSYFMYFLVGFMVGGFVGFVGMAVLAVAKTPPPRNDEGMF